MGRVVWQQYGHFILSQEPLRLHILWIMSRTKKIFRHLYSSQSTTNTCGLDCQKSRGPYLAILLRPCSFVSRVWRHWFVPRPSPCPPVCPLGSPCHLFYPLGAPCPPVPSPGFPCSSVSGPRRSWRRCSVEDSRSDREPCDREAGCDGEWGRRSVFHFSIFSYQSPSRESLGREVQKMTWVTIDRRWMKEQKSFRWTFKDSVATRQFIFFCRKKYLFFREDNKKSYTWEGVGRFCH